MSASGTAASGAQTSQSKTEFPSQFLKQYQDIFGPGFGVNELIAALPKTSGLFGGTAGLQPGPGYTGLPAPGPTAGSSLGLGSAPGQRTASQAFVPPGGGGQAAGAPAGGRTYSSNELLGYASNDPVQQRAINAVLANLGGSSSGPHTLSELRQAAEIPGVLNPKNLGALNNTFARLAADEGTQAAQPNAPRFGAPAPEVGLNAGLPGGIAGATSALGFGSLGPQAQVQDIRSPTTINAPTVNMTDLPGYQKAVFESQFRPVERELSRQGALNQQTLASTLAQRGLAGSGTGVGQQQKAQREVGQQIQFAAEDASNRASVQRFQQEYQQKLANAGFDLTAQTENARNVLLGDTAKAKNYLDTIGLNADNAAKAKTSFLSLLGVQQADLKRMDEFQLGVTDRLMNTWLQTMSTLAGAGQESTGTSKNKSKTGGLFT